jgi:integrase
MNNSEENIEQVDNSIPFSVTNIGINDNPLPVKESIPTELQNINKTLLSTADYRGFLEFMHLKKLSTLTISAYAGLYSMLYRFAVEYYKYIDESKALYAPELIPISQELINKFIEKHNGGVTRSFLRGYFQYRHIRDIDIVLITGRHARKIKYFTYTEVNTLVNAAKRYRQKCFILLGFETGLRLGEILRITAADIDFSNSSISGISEKSNKPFKVYFSARTRDYLVNLLNKENIKAGKIFPYKNNNAVYSWFNPFVRKVLNKDGSPHTLRHSTATYLVTRGVPLVKIQEYMRHASGVTTLLYAHLVDSGKQIHTVFKDNFSAVFDEASV